MTTPARHMPRVPQYYADAVSRRLCASTHLDPDFARQVRKEFTGDRIDALGLPLGVNLVALVRHAEVAVRRERARDHLFALLFALLVVTGAGAVLSFLGGAASWATSLIAAVVLLWGLAWVLRYRALGEAWNAAYTVHWGAEGPEALAPAVDPEAETGLSGLRRANVVVYDAEVGHDDPFVGHGKRVRKTVWQPIDVGSPAQAPNGGTQTITPFDEAELHTFVAREMKHLSGLKGLRSHNRLYVAGTHAPLLGGDLVPDPERPPLTRVPSALVRSALIHPGAGMRTYLSLERVGEGGRIVVVMHLRARLHAAQLSWEVTVHLIPPLGPRFDAVDHVPHPGWRRVRRMVHMLRTQQEWRLRGAPGRCLARARQRAVRARRLERERRDITRNRLQHDYGARDTLRSRWADQERMGHNELQDAQDILNRLQQGVLLATKRFLTAHHIDTSSFDSASKVINNQTYNFTGDINQGVFGAQGTIQNQYGPQPQQGSPAPQPGA
ncbi:hypothetical protein ACQYWQ_25115 [Streptomyces sp. P6-2-1]|uniref:hypothetical protein n=1 Tax=Streptomyces sp. P6-2-1 TaxID=3422591 RepID=UPI003D36500D